MKYYTFPIVSDVFNFGTIVFIQTNHKGKNKVIARFLGVKHAEEIYLELINYLEFENIDKKPIVDEFLI